MNWQIEAPLWLLLPLVLAPLWRRPVDTRSLPGQWRAVLAPAMHDYLRRFAQGEMHVPRRLLWALLLASLGAAMSTIRIGETPAPPARDLHGRILLIDLADAASAAQTVFRARQLAQRAEQTPTAIVVSAGDAYDVVPMTADPAPLTRYLDVLVPDMLPGRGHAPERGMHRAIAMFDRAGTLARQVVLLAGVAPPGPPATPVPAQDSLVIVAPAQAANAWQRWAPDALVITDEASADLDDGLNRARAEIDDRLEHRGQALTPLFIMIAMGCWLWLFGRRER